MLNDVVLNKLLVHAPNIDISKLSLFRTVIADFIPGNSINNLYINNYNIEKIQSNAYVCCGAFIPYFSSFKINYLNLYETIASQTDKDIFILSRVYYSGYIKEVFEKYIIKYTLINIKEEYDLCDIYSIIKLKKNNLNVNIIFMQQHINNTFKVVNKFFDFVYCKLLYSFSSKKIYMHQDLFDYYYYMTDKEKTFTSLGKYSYPLSYADILESDLKLLSIETFFLWKKLQLLQNL